MKELLDSIGIEMQSQTLRLVLQSLSESLLLDLEHHDRVALIIIWIVASLILTLAGGLARQSRNKLENV